MTDGLGFRFRGNDERVSGNDKEVSGNDGDGDGNDGPARSMMNLSKLAPHLNPPPQGGRRLNWCFDQCSYFSHSKRNCVCTEKSSNRVPSPLEGEGQGGGYQRMIPICHQRMRDIYERTRQRLKSAFGGHYVANNCTGHAFAAKPRSGHTSSISFALKRNSLSSWTVGSTPMRLQPIRAEQPGFKHADITLFGFGTTMSWKISKVCSKLLRRILTQRFKTDLSPSQFMFPPSLTLPLILACAKLIGDRGGNLDEAGLVHA